MSDPLRIDFLPFGPDEGAAIAARTGRIALVLDPAARRPGAARRLLDRLTRKAVSRAAASEAFTKLAPGETLELAFPAGLAAEALILVKLAADAAPEVLRRAGGALASGPQPPALILADTLRHPEELAFGLSLRAYDFARHRTSPPRPDREATRIMVAHPEAAARAALPLAALVEGVHFTRDLVNEPANILTTDSFAARLAAMQEIGLEVEILEEEDLRRLGMGALLCVGQGSDSPSKVVVMSWTGGPEGEAPLALIGKGVVFDTGGISIKPAAGMEDMTSDMGGAGVVSGVMRTLALRRARANVVGLVGLVENMPSGRAVRPGDIVRSMKGDTIEVINTDAEGRLVLADVLWYAQTRFKPAAMIDLATLTGAIVVALGSENAGLFSNDDGLAGAILAAAATEGEGAWRMPMGKGYDDLLKSRLADMKNIGGREGGAISAAQFLKRFVEGDRPWAHLDIAGVTLARGDQPLSPKGATGWGVRLLDRLVRDRFETKG